MTRSLRPLAIQCAFLILAAAAGVILGWRVAFDRYSPVREMEAALTIEAPAERFRAGIASISGQSAAGCESLAQFLEQPSVAARFGADELFRLTLFRWGQTDPRAALRFLRTTTFTDCLALSQAAILYGWLETDRAAALAWCLEYPFARFPLNTPRLTSTELAWRASAEHDLAGTLTALDTPGVESDLTGIGPFLAPNGPPANATDLPPARKNGLMRAWAMHQPSRALAWAISHSTEPASGDETILAMLLPVFEAYPRLAADLVATESERDKWLNGFDESIRLWATRDPEGVVAWVKSLPSAVATDAFIVRRIDTVAPVNPDLALDLALLIRDEIKRGWSINDSVNACVKYYPDAYADWLQRRDPDIPPHWRKPVGK